MKHLQQYTKCILAGVKRNSDGRKMHAYVVNVQLSEIPLKMNGTVGVWGQNMICNVPMTSELKLLDEQTNKHMQHNRIGMISWP